MHRPILRWCGDRIYQRKVNVKGANAFQAPIKPAPPRL
jgi:gluconolactonase